MNIFCVFQTVEYQNYDSDGVVTTETYDSLQSIWLNHRLAQKYIDEHPELELHIELWNAQ